MCQPCHAENVAQLAQRFSWDNEGMATAVKKKRSKGRNSVQFDRARERVLKHNRICQFKGNDKWPACGQVIDLDLKWPHPMSPTVDHTITVASLDWNDPLCWDVSNLQPMHLVCNQRKGDGKQKPSQHNTSRDWLA
jgi:hypothetical protein